MKTAKAEMCELPDEHRIIDNEPMHHWMDGINIIKCIVPRIPNVFCL